MRLSEPQCHQRIDAQQRHEGGLYGVDNQHESHGVGICHAIQDEDGLDGKMPGTCPVGRRNNHRDAAHGETDNRHRKAQILSEVEAVEGNPVVEEVTAPDGKGVEPEQPFVSHVFEGKDALSQFANHLLQFGHEGKPLHGDPQEDDGDDGADGCYDVSGCRKSSQGVPEVGACAVEEGTEDGNLRKNHRRRDAEQEQRVDDTLCDHGAQCL